MKFDSVFQKCTFVKGLPLITVNLALPPLARWRAVLDECSQHNVSVPNLIKESQAYLDSLLPQKCSVFDFRSTSTSWLGQWLRYCFLLLLGLLCRLFFTYSEDVVALASLVNLYTGEIFLANIAYEVLGGCTSFVVHDEQNKPMLGRTLDWPMPMLAKYTVQFRWVHEKDTQNKQHNRSKDSNATHSIRDDKRNHGDATTPSSLIPLFYSVGWPGYVGVMTGAKPHQFAVALNARYPDVAHGTWLPWLLQSIWGSGHNCKEEDVDAEELQEAVETVSRALARVASALRGTAWSTGALLRTTLQQLPTHTNKDTLTYSHVVNYLSQQRLAAPCYFIVAGVNAGEGVVLTRELHPMTQGDGVMAKRHMNMDDRENQFVCQTNIDMPLQSDHSPKDFNSVERYEVTTRKLSELSRSGATWNYKTVSPSEAAHILMTSMNKNEGVRMKMTLYCTIMTPHDGGIVSARSTRCIGP